MQVQIIKQHEGSFEIEQSSYGHYSLKNENGRFKCLCYACSSYNHEGFYFDIDIELVRRSDMLLQYEIFMGFDNNSYIL